MKKLITTILLLLVSFNVSAIDLGTIDPDVQGRLVPLCDVPTERINGDKVDSIGIKLIQFQISENGREFISLPNPTINCETSVNLTQLDDGDYTIAVLAFDMDDLPSALSTEPNVLNFTIQRKDPPPEEGIPLKSPDNMTYELHES